ncbi:hypothetical protein KPL71_006759 [Citrus sinensis]|uniref:Uncharacterized protein n=1 Tax=Citrus sinensis TaxID=2711 RepID=A0ACB8LTV7_CITSI|nr:hypothetical protein KPL71_006759 [Citrus sinensis]
MGGKVEACAECTKKCLLVHRNKAKLSPVIHSFFKIMIGKDCSEILFLPPKFAEMVSAVIGKKAVIEDSSGDCWEVSVSNVDGSPAFRQGWNAFSAYHRLEIGDFLVFDYIRGSRFIVKIFDKTGCEKQKISLTMNKRKRYRTRTNFTDREGQCYTADTGSMSKERKNARTTANSTDRDGQCHTADKDSMSKERSRPSIFSVSDEEMSESQCELNDVEKASTSNGKISGKRPLSVSRAKFLEDPYYLIDRDLGDQQREDRCSVFDLSHFEMVGNNCGTAIRDKMKDGDDYSHHADASLISEFEDVLVNKYLVDEEIPNRVAASHASDMDIMKNNGVEKTEQIISRVELQKDGGNNSNVSSGVSQKCHGAEEESKALSIFAESKRKTDRATVSPMECNQSEHLKFIGTFGESSVQVTTGMQNCRFESLTEIDWAMVSPVEYNRSTQLKLVGQYGKSRVQVTSGMQNCQFVEPQKNEGNNSNSSSGVSKKCFGAEEESNALTKLLTKVHQGMVSQTGCTSLGDSNQRAQLKFVGEFGGSSVPVTHGMLKGQFGNLPQLIKVERGLRSDMIGRENGISQVVKTETLDLVPTCYIPCATPSDGQPFLELSTCLPTSSFRGRSRTQRKVVVLRDPDMRMWPVLYHERSGFKVLTSGWEAFSKANNIQPGDGCIFGVESYSESIYGVSIVRK